MKQQMVVTNLRMPQSEYTQMKISAASAGVSVNEYIRRIVKYSAMEKMFATKISPDKSVITSFYDDMLKLAQSVPNIRHYDVSDDDAIIYGVYE